MSLALKRMVPWELIATAVLVVLLVSGVYICPAADHRDGPIFAATVGCVQKISVIDHWRDPQDKASTSPKGHSVPLHIG